MRRKREQKGLEEIGKEGEMRGELGKGSEEEIVKGSDEK